MALQGNVGDPLSVSDASLFGGSTLDTSKVYVYVGSTSGNYTHGHWFYHNGSAWTDGGEWGAGVELDATLSYNSKAAQAKAVGDQFARTNTSNSIMWEKGSYDSTDGSFYTNNSRIRSDVFFGLSTGVEKVIADNGYTFLVFAWNSSGAFVGSFHTSNTFAANANNLNWVSSFDCNNFPDYKFKIGVKNSTGSTSITTSDGINIHFQHCDETLTKKYKAADAKTVGSKINALTDILDNKDAEIYAGVVPVQLEFDHGWINSSGVYDSTSSKFLSNVVSTTDLIKVTNGSAKKIYLVYFSAYTSLSEFIYGTYSAINIGASSSINSAYPYVAIESDATVTSNLTGILLEKKTIIDYLSHDKIEAIKAETTKMFDGINGKVIYTTTLASAAYVSFNYPFIIGNTYLIDNQLNRDTSYIQLYREDGTYKQIGPAKKNQIFSFVPEENFVSLRLYSNGTGTLTFSDKGLPYQIISGTIRQNTASLAPMIASSVSKGSNYGYAKKIYPQLLVCTDIHADWTRLNRAFNYNDENGNSAFTFCLGDVCDNPTQFSDYNWESYVLAHNKPILSTLGNHDVMTYTTSGTPYRMTNEQLYEYFFSSDLQSHNGEVHDDESLYWYKDITKTYSDGSGSHTKTLRVIGLNQFEFPPNADGDRQVYVFYSQDQVDWLIDVLDNTPANTYVLIGTHSSPTKNAVIQDNPWSSGDKIGTYLTYYDNGSQGDPDMLLKIINAWITGSNVTLVNTQTLAGTTVAIEVNHTFTAHANSFAGWICGHVHFDAYAIKEGYTNQKIIAFNCSTAVDGQQDGDLGRETYGKAQDAVTLVSYDFDNNKVRLVRLGADATIFGKLRQMVII